MSPVLPLDVLGAGCVFPGGPGLALADIALETQVALMRQHPYYVDRCGHRIRVSAFPEPTLPFDAERWWALAEGALRDMQKLAGDAASPQQTGYWLLLPPEERPGMPPGLADDLLGRLRAAHPECAYAACLHADHAGAASAIELAGRWLKGHPQGAAAVIAVDCPLASGMLQWMEAADLLHGSRTPYEGNARPNPYGRIPGEGAAALLLGLPGRKVPWARLIGQGRAMEPILRSDERPCLGQGLSEAARTALQQALRTQGGQAEVRVGTIYSDLNGEPYRADQFGFTHQRITRWLKPQLERLTPALVTGDLGSASLLAHLALSAWRLKQSTDQADDKPWHLLLASGDDAERAAIVLTKAGNSPSYQERA